MRRPAALVALLLLAACEPGASGGGVRHGVVEAVEVERLDLSRRWDGAVWEDGNGPDVYVDVKAQGRRGVLTNEVRPLWRSGTSEDVGAGALPLVVRADSAVRVGLRDTLWVNVVDQDNVGDDLLFTTGDFTLADHVDGASPGGTGTLDFGDGVSSVRVTVRWE